MKKNLIAAARLLVTLVAAACTVPVQVAPEVEVPVATSAPLQPAATQPAANAIPTQKAEATPIPKAEATAVPQDSAAFASSVLMVTCSTYCNMRPVDPLTGEGPAGYSPISLWQHSPFAFSPDKKTLATVIYPSADYPSGGVLHLIDLRTWQDVATGVTLNAWTTAMSFSPDGTHLAIAAEAAQSLQIVDLAGQAVVAQTPLHFTPRLVEYTPDGGALMVYGVTQLNISPEPRVALFISADLNRVWDQALPEVHDGQYPVKAGDGTTKPTWRNPALVFSPDRSALYIVHAEEDQLTTVDFVKREVRRLDIHSAQSLLDRWMAFTAEVAEAKELDGTSKQAVISGDGKRLYVVGLISEGIRDAQGREDVKETPLGFQVIDTATGAELAHMDLQATEIKLSSDGRQLYLQGWIKAEPNWTPWVRVLDADSLAEMKSLDEHSLIPTRRMDGQPILLGIHLKPNGLSEFGVVNPQTFQVTPSQAKSYVAYGYMDWLVIP